MEKIRNKFVQEGKRIPFPKGKKLDDPFFPPNIYGGGIWYVITEKKIWMIKNNGADGDFWGINWIKTGGAGAYGFLFDKTDARIEALTQIQKKTFS